MNILFTAEHFGSACAVVPIYLEATKRKGLNADIFLPVNLTELGLLQDSKNRINWFSVVPGDYMSFLEGLDLSRYDAFVTGVTGMGGTSLASAVVRHGRSRAIPSIGILDSWINYAERFDDPSGKRNAKLAFLPDYLSVPDEFAYRDLDGLGFPTGRLWITGHPYIETIGNEWTQRKTEENRRRIYEELSLKNELLLVFVHEAISDIYANGTAYTEYDSLDLLIKSIERIQNEKGVNIRLVIQIHPRTSLESERKLEDFLGKNNRSHKVLFSLVRSSEPLVWCMAADIVIGMTSALLAYSVILEKNVIVLQPGIAGQTDKQIVSRKKMAPLAVNESQLTEGLLNHIGKDRRIPGNSSTQWGIKKNGVSSGIIEQIVSLIGGR